MLAIESLAQGDGERLVLRIADGHPHPGHGLQDGPMPTDRDDQRGNNERSIKRSDQALLSNQRPPFRASRFENVGARVCDRSLPSSSHPLIQSSINPLLARARALALVALVALRQGSCSSCVVVLAFRFRCFLIDRAPASGSPCRAATRGSLSPRSSPDS
jgi:hypothetical protein